MAHERSCCSHVCVICLQAWCLTQKKILWIFMMAWMMIPAAIEVSTSVMHFIFLCKRKIFLFFCLLKYMRIRANKHTYVCIVYLYALVRHWKKVQSVFYLNTEEFPDAFQLKESMDLYEEIVTEEQQNRESTYLEVKTVGSLFFIIVIISIIISSTGSSNVIDTSITISIDSVIPCVCS